ncbi:putative elongator complex protein 4-like [Apostichopus japonicus]|uniref:Elongator complex protein 4 n=1 Tax=Stichopus japonicus TaxID=307972 RepID=A0A2G8JZS7_STIJA|nr:putative elongator complex protein 4-like [Apostichopus japonicus]
MHEHINFVQKEEDTYGHHAHLLLRYFLAEGIMTDHQLFLASANEDPEKILKNLPYPVEGDKLLAEDAMTGADVSSVSEPMKIAWRYECLPKVQDSSTSHKFGHSYDLSRTATSDLLSRVKTGTFYLSEEMKKEKRSSHPFLCPTHQRLLERIEREIKDGEFHLTENAQSKQSLNRTVLRIGLQSYGSTLWWDEGYSDKVETSTSLCRFFHALRALLRNSLAVAMVTMPVHLLHDFVEVRRLERLCDAAVQIESFAGSEKETNPIFQDYHGLLHIKHLPRLNSLTVSTPDSMDLGFKLKRKKLTIEKLHLPPEFSDSVSRPQEDTVLHSGGGGSGCSSTLQKRHLDSEAAAREIIIEGFVFSKLSILPLSFLRAKLKLERERKRNPNGHYGYLLS